MARPLIARIERTCADHGLLFPWWVPATCFVGEIVCVGIALVLRDAWWPPELLTLTLAVVALPMILQFGLLVSLPWWLDALGALVAAGWLLAVPVASDLGALDAAPALLMFVTAEIVARDGLRQGAVVGLVSMAMIAAAAAWSDLAGSPVHLLTVLLGYVVGAMLRWQMRALAAEREAREQAWQQATLAERQRIAREIHDLVAHSLSVTLLHLTGARHALRDLSSAGAVDGASAGAVDGAATAAEVDAALADAEQVGRQAMSEIRRTVSTLADGPAPAHALPGAEGIGALVHQLGDAGLTVTYDETGDPASLPAAVGLGLYRIAQESLSNVAKHAATSTAQVRFAVDESGARLEVRNRLVGSDALLGRRSRADGSGLAGMQARAEQLGARLTAGPRDGEWLVRVEVPRRRTSARQAAPGAASSGPVTDVVSGSAR
jgi:signal transduction histidine kinase